MDTEAKFTLLEERIGHVEGKVDNTLEVLAQMNEKLKKLDVIEDGIFGNEKLGYAGVIKTQALLQERTDLLKKELQDQIDILKKEVDLIHKVNNEQTVAIDAKRSLKLSLWEIGKWLFQAAVTSITVYLIVKGVVGADALIK